MDERPGFRRSRRGRSPPRRRGRGSRACRGGGRLCAGGRTARRLRGSSREGCWSRTWECLLDAKWIGIPAVLAGQEIGVLAAIGEQAIPPVVRLERFALGLRRADQRFEAELCAAQRSAEHTSELPSLLRIPYA